MAIEFKLAPLFGNGAVLCRRKEVRVWGTAADGQTVTGRVTTADGKASQALQTANGFSARITNAEGDIASLELSLSGVVASVEGNRLVFDSNGLTIKNAAGETVFFSSAITGTLNITGNINAAGGTIGGFTIGDNSITAPNGVKLYS